MLREELGVYRVRLDDDLDPAEVVDQLRLQPDVTVGVNHVLPFAQIHKFGPGSDPERAEALARSRAIAGRGRRKSCGGDNRHRSIPHR